MHLVLVPPVVALRDPYAHHSAPTALVVGAPPAVVAKGHTTHTQGEKGHEEGAGSCACQDLRDGRDWGGDRKGDGPS